MTRFEPGCLLLDAAVTASAFGVVVIPKHPFWCDDCGNKSAFQIKGCEIDHSQECPRFDEDAGQVFDDAVAYVKRTGKAIP